MVSAVGVDGDVVEAAEGAAAFREVVAADVRVVVAVVLVVVVDDVVAVVVDRNDNAVDEVVVVVKECEGSTRDATNNSIIVRRNM